MWLPRKIIRSFILSAALLFTLPAYAGEYVYSPEGCEFEITFPGEPHTVRRCHDKLTDHCSLMTGYTQVFDLDATVNFYVSCKPSEENIRKDFTPDLMRTSLLARPNADLLEVYNISTSDTDEALMGALFGAGTTANGNDQMVYVAQLWIGNKSIITFEGEMIGAQRDDADKLFADVMRSMRHKAWKTGTKAPVPDAIPAQKEEAPAKEAPSGEKAPAEEKPAEEPKKD